tara:strand:+ start:1222 stop:1614 length:393 start_codon:yes stop_codon:yes gene_type:complete
VLRSPQKGGRLLREDLEEILTTVHWEARQGHTYIPDKEQYGVREYWKVDLIGDCEDFALWCKQKLEKDYGIDTDLIFCKTETGGGHLVASVEGWILDNRYDWVLSKDDIPYEWLKLGRKGIWYDLTESPN